MPISDPRRLRPRAPMRVGPPASKQRVPQRTRLRIAMREAQHAARFDARC